MALLPVYIMGKKYEIPEGYTIMKAFEYAGYKLIRGCGCRGGACGACATVYRIGGDYRLRVGLACQTPIQAEMYLTQIPFFPAQKANYDLDEIKSPFSKLIECYPEITRCLGCNACTKACPQELPVMQYIACALRGDFAKSAELSFDCLMCGICASRCPAEICQYNVAMYVRRAYGKYMSPKSSQLRRRTDEIRAGKYKDEIERLKHMSLEELKKLYAEREIVKKKV